MLNVFLTVDTGIEHQVEEHASLYFADAFQRAIYGPTKHGNCALPLLFNVLNENGLAGSFFVEPLFALHVGLEPLQEVESLIKSAGHEVQLQIKTEWLTQLSTDLFDEDLPSTTLIRDLSLEQQTKLIKVGVDLFERAGIKKIDAFRAGSHGLNRNTLKALYANGIRIDSTYNKASNAGVADVLPEQLLHQPTLLDGVVIYPVSVFDDNQQYNLRSLQLTQCSYREFETVLIHAAENKWNSVVIVARSVDLMTPGQERRDSVVYQRFRKLCKLLTDYPDLFNVRGFAELQPEPVLQQPSIPASGQLNRYLRIGEQAIRRVI
jgi:hypothetical protein